MNDRTLRAIAKLSESMAENLPYVKQKLSEGGVSSDNALVYSVAKYFPALNKLAEDD